MPGKTRVKGKSGENVANFEKVHISCERIVPDTSIIIEGFISRKIEKGQLDVQEILVHEAVMAELESQANKNKETGYLGLEEVRRLRQVSLQHGLKVIFKGARPTDFEIRHAKTGEIDSLIRQLAQEEGATLVTADRVQSLVAESRGVKVILYEFEAKEKKFILDKYFDRDTMSVQIRERCRVRAKKGIPGRWRYVAVSHDTLDRDAVKEIAKAITEEASARPDGLVEADRKGSTILKIADNRIAITRPPFSDRYEITCVRPVRKLSLGDYKVDKKALARIDGAKGILIAGATGHGKTTFAQALALHYQKKDKFVKTIENPRDLMPGDEITQYSLTFGSHQELQDLLFLSRPDYAIFDEIRNTEDVHLFSDLRMSGIAMVGVMHATRAIDAVQRFLGRTGLGVLPHIIDTVIFLKEGRVDKVFSLSLEVPGGMPESGHPRPFIVAHNLLAGKPEYEIHSHGEQTIVLPVVRNHKVPV